MHPAAQQSSLGRTDFTDFAVMTFSAITVAATSNRTATAATAAATATATATAVATLITFRVRSSFALHAQPVPALGSYISCAMR